MKCDLEKKKKEHYKNISINLMEQTQLEIEFITEQLKYLQEKKALKEEQVPLQIRRKAYFNWNLEMEELNDKIFRLYNERQKLYLQIKEKKEERK